MWEEDFPWNDTQISCMDNWVQDRSKTEGGAGLREVQKEGGRIEAEGNPMDWNSSCASGCETCNCCTCGFRDDLFSSILSGLSYQVDKAISRPNFTNCIWTPLVAFSVHYQLPISLHLHPNTIFSPSTRHLRVFTYCGCQIPTAAPSQASFHPQSQHCWNSTIFSFLPIYLKHIILSVNHLDVYGRWMIN